MNICSRESISLIDAVTILSDELGVEPRVEYRERRSGDQVATAGDPGLAESILGWSPATRIEAGLRLQAQASQRDAIF